MSRSRRAQSRRGGALAAAVVLSAGAVAFGASAVSARQDSRGAATDRCRPVVTSACLSGAEARARAASSTAAALTLSDFELAAGGMPSVAAVQGGNAAAARSSFNKQLVAALTGPLTRSRRPAVLGAGVGLPSDVVGAAVDVDQRIGSSPQLFRSVHMRVQTDACPKMAAAQNTDANLKLVIGGSIGWVGIWTRGRRTIKRSVSVSLPAIPLPTGTGYVDRNALYGGYHFDQINVYVKATQRITSAGGPPVESETTGDLAAQPGTAGWNVTPGPSFAEWVARMDAQEQGAPAPGGLQLSSAQIGSGFRGLVRTFMNLLDAQLRRAIAQAQREGWQKPNGCARLEWSPKAGEVELQPGQKKPVEGRILARRGGPDGYSTWPTDPKQYVGRVLQKLASASRQGQPMRLVVQGAKAVGGHSVRFVWTVPSTVGVAQEEWTAKGREGPPPGWFGHATYEDTLAQTSQRSTVNVSGTVTLRRLSRDPTQYQVTSGTIAWDASGSDANCSWTSTGSRKATKYDLFLQLDLSSSPFRATFSAQDTVDVTATQTCQYGQKTTTSQIQQSIVHPFFMLARISQDAPIATDLETISGSKSGSQTAGDASEKWSLTYGFQSTK